VLELQSNEALNARLTESRAAAQVHVANMFALSLAVSDSALLALDLSRPPSDLWSRLLFFSLALFDMHSHTHMQRHAHTHTHTHAHTHTHTHTGDVSRE
jgi:hypothetical protein